LGDDTVKMLPDNGVAVGDRGFIVTSLPVLD